MRLRSFLFAAAVGITSWGSAHAQNASEGGMSVESAWARPTPEGAKVGGAYVTLKNNGNEDDKLVAAQSGAAARVEIHEHIQDGDVMRMREVVGGLPIRAGNSVEMKPGGYHIMLMGLTQKLAEGASIPLTLTFEKAGRIPVDVQVRKDAPMSEASMPAGHMH